MRKILLCQFGGLGEKAIEESLTRLGYQVHVFRCKSDNYDYDQTLLQEINSVIKKYMVDMVFSINFLPIISKVCNVYKIPYVSWIYDCPELHLYSSALSNPVNRIFLFDRVQFERFYPINPEHIFYLPLATKPMTEETMAAITQKEHEKYDSDICFVGSLYNESDKRFHELKNLPPYWKGFVEGLVEAQRNVFGYNFIADSLTDYDVQELKKLLKYVLIDDYREADREVIADMYIGPMCSALDRKYTIEHLAKKRKVRLYTGSNTDDMKNIDNKGIADSITMMPKIFHCSKINLNITSKTIQSGIPLRVFDILGSGGFLITNYQSEICELFEPGVDLVVYEDLQDLDAKVDYYLEHEEERIQIAKHGYRTVCQKYTYDIVLEQLLCKAGKLV